MGIVRFGFLSGLATVFSLFLVVGSAQAQSSSEGMQIYQKHVETHPSQGDIRTIEGAEAVLVTTKDGVFASISTRELVPGNAYTMWFVAINEPKQCETIPCKAPDVLKRTELTKSDVGYADGLIAGADGTGHFSTYVPRGSLRKGWLGNGLQNPQSAEIHLVINDHGPLVAEHASAMIGSYRGGCTEESLPPPFPASAKGDGTPGPNACKLVQDVIFVQTQN